MSLIELLCFLIFSRFGDVSSVTVKTDQGWLKGQILVPSTGKGEYYSFKGIPYAQPPVGNLRFRAPQPPRKWKQTRNATEHGSVCVQFKDLLSTEVIGDENCLFLNVYTPDINPTRPLPVMVFIHGGFFRIGSGNDDLYAPDFLMSYGVVLVTINYRLNSFGFISVYNEEAPGNAGLKDQIAALKWVRRNIRNFGGDPDCVTIFGDSAGASSISLHIISPAAKGLFHRAIIMSGVYSNVWSISFDPEQRAFAVGRKLGIITNNTYVLLNYLRKIPASDLIRIQPDILLSDKPSARVLTTVYFTPVVEKKFGKGLGQYITECPTSMMRKGKVNRADLLIGHTALEGLRDAALATESFLKYYPNYKELLVPLTISYYRNPKKVLDLANQIQKFYFGNQSIGLKTIKELITYYTYSHYVYDIHAYTERLPSSSSKLYFYEFAIYSTRNAYSKPGAKKFGIKEATHMDDLPYLFDGSGYNITKEESKQAYKYVQLMNRLYTNFAKRGTPTPDDSLGLIWPQYRPERNYVVIGKRGNFTVGTVSYNATPSLGFWQRLYTSVGIYL